MTAEMRAAELADLCGDVKVLLLAVFVLVFVTTAYARPSHCCCD